MKRLEVSNGTLSGLDPAYLAAKEKLAAGKILTATSQAAIWSHQGKTLDHRLRRNGRERRDAQGGSQLRGRGRGSRRQLLRRGPVLWQCPAAARPGLKALPAECFLACKTLERDAAGAAKELKQSLKLLKTDHFDLYQLHALSDVEEVEQAFGPGGAMETILKAKQDGKIRYIGFSAHSEEAAHAAMDRFDFDSILFPLSFPLWIKAKFGPSVYKRAKKAGMGILALKAMAHQLWPKGRTAMDQDLLRTLRRNRRGGLGPAIHTAPARDRHVPARSLGIVQDGVGLGPGRGPGAVERR